ncbi:MAG: aminotransferase class III-fold pyridoxal phosphate-dependent enzyme [Bryobacterales bacterium]|nr:aminotransferase class III-fold pyridoxal phosphate-dependent enzyme [Bryobacterales bacterium]
MPAPPPETGPALYRRARQRIPGGTQLLSKRPEMFLPEQWPAYYAEARGAEVWDLDGRRYLDMSIGGIGACVLGFADPDVDGAVRAAIDRGVACTLNCPEEPALADVLCELHPWADMVRLLRCGGEAMAAAVRIARARTKRDKIVFCGYHGWHDWYLAANLTQGDQLQGHLLPGLDPAGVPRALAGTAAPFAYNDESALEKALASAGGDLAAIVMEPIRSAQPAAGFLERVREAAHRRGALLVFDEVTAGFRMNTGGAHLTLGVQPDLAVFAKALGNGYPMAAIIGTGDAMQAAQDTFISSTNWTERTGPAAALAMLAKHRRVDAGAHLTRMGEAVRACWRAAAEASGVRITVAGGLAALARFSFDEQDAAAVRTLFTQQMLDRGFLAGTAFYAMYAHRDEHVVAYAAAVAEVFQELAQAVGEGTVARQLRGSVAHGGFQRLA